MQESPIAYLHTENLAVLHDIIAQMDMFSAQIKKLENLLETLLVLVEMRVKMERLTNVKHALWAILSIRQLINVLSVLTLIAIFE